MSVSIIVQGNLLPIRNLFICLGLLGNAVSTYAVEPERWCSPEGYDHPAELVILDDGPVIKINGKAEHLGAEGQYHLMHATMDYETGGMMYRDQKVMIYHDHVFWPCQAQ